MSASHVQSWRNRTKVRMLKAMGNSCQICGYSKCSAALEFHHIDPSSKEFTFATAMKNPSSWGKLVVELRKCVLLCANCHREVHHSNVSLSGVESGFDEEYAEYCTKETIISLCPMCGKDKNVNAVTCSVECARKRSRLVDWDNIDVYNLVDKYKNPEQVGKYLGISGAAVRKRIKKLNAEKCINADWSSGSLAVSYADGRGFESLIRNHASMVKLVDTPDLGSGTERCVGSSPTRGTK